MPIYEYRCDACGHQEDHLQKMSEAPLTKCPACGKKTYKKQLTRRRLPAEGQRLVRDRLQDHRQEAGRRSKADVEDAKRRPNRRPNRRPETKTETKTESKPEKKTPAGGDQLTDQRATQSGPARAGLFQFLATP